MIEGLTGVAPSLQRLFYLGQDIVAGRSIAEYNFKPNGTIHFLGQFIGVVQKMTIPMYVDDPEGQQYSINVDETQNTNVWFGKWQL